MTKTNTLKKFALVAALSLSAISAASSGVQAMTLHNCTDDLLQVRLMDKNGNYGIAQVVSPDVRKSIHATRSYGPYRIVLPQHGPGAHFSGRDGEGVYSLLRTNGGNIGLRNGNVCHQFEPKPKPEPVSGGGTGSGSGAEVCFKNDFGFQVCLRP